MTMLTGQFACGNLVCPQRWRCANHSSAAGNIGHIFLDDKYTGEYPCENFEPTRTTRYTEEEVESLCLAVCTLEDVERGAVAEVLRKAFHEIFGGDEYGDND